MSATQLVAHETTPAPVWATVIRAWTTWLTQDCLGGPRPWTMAQLINIQKAGTPFFLGFLIWWYGNYGAPAWIYFALHGGYGIAWFIKSRTFPDARWEKRVTIAAGINLYLLVLGWYWVFGWLLISRAPPEYPLPDPVWFALCIGLCLIGLTIMMVADAHKYFTLRVRQGLITDGMFGLVRHPNYLGEMMIYASFALMVWKWLPFLVLAGVWLFEFAVAMVLIEARMSRHQGWERYRQRTWWVLPGVI